MELTCRTTYDRRALATLSRALRKTVRRTRARLLRVWCGALLALSLLAAWGAWGQWGSVALDGAVAGLMLAVLLGEDAINAFFASRSALPGMEVCTVRFLEEHYETQIAGAVTRWQYGKILRLAENDRCLVLILGKNHGQLCDKEGLTGGTPEELRALLEEKTGLTVQRFR